MLYSIIDDLVDFWYYESKIVISSCPWCEIKKLYLLSTLYDLNFGQFNFEYN